MGKCKLWADQLFDDNTLGQPCACMGQLVDDTNHTCALEKRQIGFPIGPNGPMEAIGHRVPGGAVGPQAYVGPIAPWEPCGLLPLWALGPHWAPYLLLFLMRV